MQLQTQKANKSAVNCSLTKTDTIAFSTITCMCIF